MVEAVLRTYQEWPHSSSPGPSPVRVGHSIYVRLTELTANLTKYAGRIAGEEILTEFMFPRIISIKPWFNTTSLQKQRGVQIREWSCWDKIQLSL
jgi:hypothetical protein